MLAMLRHFHSRLGLHPTARVVSWSRRGVQNCLKGSSHATSLFSGSFPKPGPLINKPVASDSPPLNGSASSRPSCGSLLLARQALVLVCSCRGSAAAKVCAIKRLHALLCSGQYPRSLIESTLYLVWPAYAFGQAHCQCGCNRSLQFEGVCRMLLYGGP